MVREHAVQLATVFLKRWTRKNDCVKDCRSVKEMKRIKLKMLSSRDLTVVKLVTVFCNLKISTGWYI
jgi:hypothetical protein